MPPPESVRISTRRRARRGSWASASRVTSMCSARGVRPGVTGPQHDGQRLPARPGAVIGERGQRMEPKRLLPGGAAFSFSECASTIVASISTGIRPPSAPGARSPASAQARSRAAARALRIARSARGASAASALISREITGSDATGPHSSGWARSTATSARQSPPSASVMARSVRIFPGSCTARGARHRASPAAQAPAQARHPRGFGQQQRAGLGHQPLPVSRHGDLGAARGILHPESAFGLAWTGP